MRFCICSLMVQPTAVWFGTQPITCSLCVFHSSVTRLRVIMIVVSDQIGSVECSCLTDRTAMKRNWVTGS